MPHASVFAKADFEKAPGQKVGENQMQKAQLDPQGKVMPNCQKDKVISRRCDYWIKSACESKYRLNANTVGKQLWG